ncbi:hypothetical protein PFISCL1PPCAC_20526 [Pristionchus fissidentatus]|uniref:C3H1-type domain-containing protein n=1 Tax=Pristionchus fissidentatus TaxID=1538716 RepID=A0AAV5WHD3_9BILA|nr:hypothetical protein PFISCL1PPCAC_20526 [Pristionchus fissidentatus]
MHASAASFGSSEQQQQKEFLQLQHQLQQSASAQRAALPSLASLRMHAPASYADSSFAGAPAAPSFGARSGSSLSAASSSSTLNSSRGGHNNSKDGGFWKNPILYKTTICDNWSAKKPCKYGARCWYAHGFGELRYVPRLDQLPENVREALFVEPALARAFFQEMSSPSLDGFSSASSSAGTRSEYDSRASIGRESRASLASMSSSSLSGSCRLSMSPSSSASSGAISPSMHASELFFSPPAAANDDRRAKRWAPGALWSENAETPRVSRQPTTVFPKPTVLTKPVEADTNYRLFDTSHPLAIDLSFLKE